MNNNTCYDCGNPAEAIDLNAYGPGKPESYCYQCFITNTFPSDLRVPVTFLGDRDYEVRVTRISPLDKPAEAR